MKLSFFALRALGNIDSKLLEDEFLRRERFKKLYDSSDCQRKIDALHILLFRPIG